MNHSKFNSSILFFIFYLIHRAESIYIEVSCSILISKLKAPNFHIDPIDPMLMGGLQGAKLPEIFRLVMRKGKGTGPKDRNIGIANDPMPKSKKVPDSSSPNRCYCDGSAGWESDL